MSPDATTEAVLGLTFDCVDAPALAAFWALALGYVEAPPPEGWATWDAFLTDQQVPQEEWDEGAEIQPTSGTGPTISFLKVPEPKVAKNRVHLDVKVSGGRHIEPSAHGTDPRQGGGAHRGRCDGAARGPRQRFARPPRDGRP